MEWHECGLIADDTDYLSGNLMQMITVVTFPFMSEAGVELLEVVCVVRKWLWW